ncbi:ABC transporter ATP-binding protein [Alkalitalea saponilacus]|uniref:ABC-2 type transport system ATP-binding protein n=1 Tax=Alkalitalea saponilacus TaxID=889453 RepID=A0A1T5ASF3_9BACT|nr:ATP-binding cassette domain-containing protein [Alkalitalea saponilacus]ASB48616.1 ABC transporter ATP-binding protein [Alkalitalea saponilacus]SKB37750.1 ABC-2 type transport system ATP-binding protein [Alkalitalea saponilacus]
MAFLEAKDVVKQYAGHLALDHVSVSVPENTIFGLLGPNGAGKTTLIRIINQITGPDSGSILINNKPLKSSDIARIGYLPEERGLYKKMKVGEQALYLAQLKDLSRRDALKKLKYWFEKFEIQAWWDKKVEELSKGMQQKVQFIVTILHNPQLLIFDEPFSGFDPINASLLKDEILNLKKEGATIIFSTHNMSSVEALCDHITLINNGKAILNGAVHDIRYQYRENLIKLEYSGDTDKLKETINNSYEIIESGPSNGFSSLLVKMDEGNNMNQLLKLVMNDCEIHSCKEVLPGMDDVFIKVVNENK